MKRFIFYIILAVLLTMLTPVYSQETGDKLLAVVAVSSAEIFQEPDPASPLSTFTPTRSQGTRMVIVDQVDGWYQVQLRTAELAWVRMADVGVEPYISPATLIPSDAPFYVTLDISPGFFNRIGALYAILNGSPEEQAISTQVDDMLRFLFMNPDIELDSVRQWLGDEMIVSSVACQDPVAAGSVPEDPFPTPNVAIVVPIFNPQLAQSFYDTQFTEGGFADVAYQEIEYMGYTYRLLDEAPQVGPPVVAMGIIDDYFVFTQGTAPMESIIDVLNGAPSLADGNQGFQDGFAELGSEDYFLRMFANSTVFCGVSDPFISDAISVDESTPLGDVDLSDPDVRNALIEEAFQGYTLGYRDMGGSITLDLVSGLDTERLQTITGLTDEEVAEIEQSIGLATFGFLTPELLDTLTFGTVAGSFDSLTTIASTDQTSTFANNTGLDPDVFNQLAGSFTMGFVQYPVLSTDETSEPYFFLAVEASDEAALQATFDALVGTPETDPVIREIDGISVTELSQDENTLEVATIGNYVVLVTNNNMDNVIEQLVIKENQFSPNWAALVGASPEGQFVTAIDLASVVSGAQLQASVVITPDVTPTRISIICTLCFDETSCAQ